MAFIKHTVIHTTNKSKTVFTEENQTYKLLRKYSDGSFYKCAIKNCKRIIIISGTECYGRPGHEHNHSIAQNEENKKICEAKNRAKVIRAINEFLRQNPKIGRYSIFRSAMLQRFVEKEVGKKFLKNDQRRLSVMKRAIEKGNKNKLAGLSYTIERVEIIPKEKIIIKSSERAMSTREMLKKHTCTG